MKVLEVQFLEGIRNVNAGGRATGNMIDRWPGGSGSADGPETCRVFGPGVVLEREGADPVMVPWGNVKWVRVEQGALAKK